MTDPNNPSAQLPDSGIGADERLRHEFAANRRAPQSNPNANTHLQNRPEPVEQYFRTQGEEFIKVEPETRVQNCALFKFSKEDHTMANLLRDRCLRNPAVLFSGYKVPHPLYAEFELRIQTDGSITPRQAVIQAAEENVNDLATLSREFTKEWELQRLKVGMEDGSGGAGGAGGAGGI